MSPLLLVDASANVLLTQGKRPWIFRSCIICYHEHGTLESETDRFERLREVRLVPRRRGIAFVEYEAEAGAISA